MVLGYLRAQADKLKSLDPQVRGDEPDSVHQMRVTTRRLRATLRSFRRVLPRASTQTVAAELKWLGGVLGEARDAEVLSDRLQANARQIPAEHLIGPVQARIQGHFAPTAAAARADVLATLDSPRYFALLDELDQLLAAPPLGSEAAHPAAEVLPAAVRRSYRKAAGGCAARAAPARARAATSPCTRPARRSGAPATPPSGRHGRPQARKFTKKMKKIQSVLGDHQDAVITSETARQLGISAHLAGENAFSYGLLHERDTHHRRTCGPRPARPGRRRPDASTGAGWSNR